MPIFITQGRYTEHALKGMMASPEDRVKPLAGVKPLRPVNQGTGINRRRYARRSFGDLAFAASTAGLIDWTRPGKWPGSSALSSTTLIAAATAPQFECPRTRTSGTPRNFTAYSRLASTQTRGQQPRSALLAKSYFGCLDAGLREAVVRIASSHCVL